MSYILSKERAMEADTPAFIAKSGIYKGYIKEAYEVVSKNGAVGVRFEFSSPAGNADLTLWTFGKNKQPTFNMGFIDALLAITKTKSAEKVDKEVDIYDPEVKERVKKPVQAFPAFCKPIAVCLQKEEFCNQNGDIRSRMNLKHFLHPDTLQTAREMYEKLEASDHLRYEYEDIKYTPESASDYTHPLDVSQSVNDDEIPF